MAAAICHVREQHPTPICEYGMRWYQLLCSITISSLWLNCPRCWSTLIYLMTYGTTCTNPLFEPQPLCSIRTQVPLILLAVVGTRSNYLSQHQTSPGLLTLVRSNMCPRMHHHTKCAATPSMCPQYNGWRLKIKIVLEYKHSISKNRLWISPGYVIWPIWNSLLLYVLCDITSWHGTMGSNNNLIGISVHVHVP